MNIFQNKPKSNSATFFCFAPIVSLSTFIIEFIFALHIFLRYKRTLFNTLCIISLLCLGIFQFSEFLICTSPYKDAAVKMGYIAITLLPSLGIHLISVITKRWKSLVYISYILAGGLIVAIVFIPEIAFVASCQKYYVNIVSNNLFSILHNLFYSAFLLLGIGELWYAIVKKIGDSRLEKLMILSYLVFIIPSMALFYLRVIEKISIASVMCAFAVLTACIYVFFVIPRYYKLRKIKKKIRKR